MPQPCGENNEGINQVLIVNYLKVIGKNIRKSVSQFIIASIFHEIISYIGEFSCLYDRDIKCEHYLFYLTT